MSVKTENITIEDLLNKVSTYDDNTEDQTLIRNAYDYAYRKHFSQKRITGDDYITHPLNVAWILTDVKADGITIAAICSESVEKFRRFILVTPSTILATYAPNRFSISS